MAGAVVQWLRDEMGLIETAAESEHCAQLVPDTEGVYLVPAFTGLGAPYWDMDARGLLCGLTRSTNKNHIIRAGLEAIAFQTRDVLEAMQEDSGIELATLQVDGGATANNFLMQFQADILGVGVRRPADIESTAFGAALLAGLAVNFWDMAEIEAMSKGLTDVFHSQFDEETRASKYKGWVEAVRRTRVS